MYSRARTTSAIALLGAILFGGCSSPRDQFDNILDRVMDQEMEIRTIYRDELDAIIAENSEIPDCPTVSEELREALRDVWTTEAREYFQLSQEERDKRNRARETDDALHRASRTCTRNAELATRHIESLRTWTRSEEEVREKYGNFAVQVARMDEPIFLRTLEQLLENHRDKPRNDGDIAIVNGMLPGARLQVNPDEAADRIATYRTNIGNAQTEVLKHLETWTELMETAQAYLE